MSAAVVIFAWALTALTFYLAGYAHGRRTAISDKGER